MSRRNKKNILIVTTSFPCLGKSTSGNFVYELAKRLVGSYNITVLAPHHSGFKLREKWSGISIYRFRYFWPISWQKVCYGSGILSNLKNNKLLFFILPFLFISQFLKTIYLIRKEKIDLVHAHWFFPSGLIAGLAAKIYQKSLIVTAHGSDIMILKGWFWQTINKMVIKLAKAITVVSLEIKENLEKKLGNNVKKVFYTPMGVETKIFKPDIDRKRRDLNKPTLLFVGRLSKIKGIDYLIKALPKVAEKFPQTELTLIGSGHEKKEFELLAADLGLKNSVSFLGNLFHQELPKYYQQADVFVLPSLSEGTPVSVLEAMSSGCPVVATKIGGLKTLIQNGKNGLLINPGSSEELTQAIIRILSDGNLRDNIIKQACKTIKQGYDWSVAINRFKKAYQICLYE